jgi:hypothetical protein
MTKPAVGDIVLFNFKTGDATTQRPAIVLSSKDAQTISVSVMIDKLADGQFGLSDSELLAGVAWRPNVNKGGNDGQWTGKP